MAPVPGLDTDVGLSRALGDRVVYLQMLARFRAEHADFAARFWDAQFGHDPRAAARLAHSLKGSAGHLGAQQLYLAASLLEGLCGQQASPQDIHKALDLLLNELQRVLAGIDMLGGTGAEPPAEMTANATLPGPVSVAPRSSVG